MPKTVPQLPGIEPGPYPVLARSSRPTASCSSPARSGTRPGSHGAVPGGIEAETRAMLENVGRLLRPSGSTIADVVKCTVYLRDFAEFAAMNAVYREYFPTEPPTRATVGVTALAADYPDRDRGDRGALVAARLLRDPEPVDGDHRPTGRPDDDDA